MAIHKYVRRIALDLSLFNVCNPLACRLRGFIIMFSSADGDVKRGWD